MLHLLAHASALLAFWSGAICLGRGALWTVLYVISELCVAALQLIARSMHVVFTYHMLLRWSTAVWNLQPCLHV
jgi:hypothetical protein